MESVVSWGSISKEKFYTIARIPQFARILRRNSSYILLSHCRLNFTRGDVRIILRGKYPPDLNCLKNKSLGRRNISLEEDDQKFKKKQVFFQLKVRSSIKLKMNMNYYLYQGGLILQNTSLFTLKFEFCPNSLRTTPKILCSLNQNNKKLFFLSIKNFSLKSDVFWRSNPSHIRDNFCSL